MNVHKKAAYPLTESRSDISKHNSENTFLTPHHSLPPQKIITKSTMAPLSTFLSLLLPALASALPDVTPVQLGAGSCAGYPEYPQDGDISGGFYFQADQGDNSTVDGLWSSLEPLNLTVVDITTVVGSAMVMYQCDDAAVREIHSGTPIYIANDGSADDGELGWFASGNTPEVYQHQVDGVAQSGLFLGYGGVTAWAYTFVPSTGGAGIYDMFTLRLLDAQDAPLNDGEFYGFLKVVSA